MTISVLRDVVHAQPPGYRPLSLDLFLPEAGAGAICVYVHGGGWRVGSRRSGPGPVSPTSGRLLHRMAERGLAVAAVDYRLSGEARFPAQLDDVRAACAWVGGELSPVRDLPLVLFGVSAGGQLAALCGLDPALGARAVACWYPVTDLAALPEDIEGAGGVPDRDAGSREAQLLGAPAADAPELARIASPTAGVNSQAPPFLLVHGDADDLVPIRQSRRLHEALLRCGVPSTLVPVPGRTHMFPGMPDGELEALTDRTADFLLSHCATSS